MPSIINLYLDIWLSRPRQIKFLIFVMNFSSNSLIGDKGHPLPDVTPLTEHKLCLVSGLDFTKDPGTDKILVFDLKKFNLELFLILKKSVQHLLEGETFPTYTEGISCIFGLLESESIHLYCNHTLLSVISKMFEATINKKVVSHHNRNKVLGNKRYIFRPCRSIVGVLTVIMHRISKAFDNKLITRAITLDTLKTFDKI